MEDWTHVIIAGIVSTIQEMSRECNQRMVAAEKETAGRKVLQAGVDLPNRACQPAGLQFLDLPTLSPPSLTRHHRDRRMCSLQGWFFP